METKDETSTNADDATAEAPRRESFVPSSLASFITKAQATLDDVQHSLHLDSPAKNSNASVSMDQDTSFASMREDEDDKKLKQEVLDNLNRRNTTDKEKNEASIAETATNLLLALDEVEEEVVMDGASQTLPAQNAERMPMSPPGEGIEFSMADLLSPETAASSPGKSITTTDKVITPSRIASTTKTLAIDTTNTEPDRLSPGSRASGWKDLIASAPTRNATPKTPVEQGIEYTESGLLSPDAASSDSVSKVASLSSSVSRQGANATPTATSVPEIAKVGDNVDTAVSASSLSTNKDLTTGEPASPRIPTTIDTIPAMSCALEVTSPLETKEASKLSPSAPQVAQNPSSPWRNALQGMVTQLEDRATPPSTFEASTASPLPPGAKQSPLANDASARSRDQSAASTPKVESSQVPRKSGLVLSPSDSLPPPSAADLSPPPRPLPTDDAASPATMTLQRSSLSALPTHHDASSPDREQDKAVSAPSPGSERKSGLVLSPSDSLPSPNTARKSGMVLSSPSDSLPKASPQLRKESKITFSPEPSRSKASPRHSKGNGEDETTVSPPKPSPQATAEATDHVNSAPQATRTSGLLLSPSDSLPPPSAGKNVVTSSPKEAQMETATFAAGSVSGPPTSCAEICGQVSTPSTPLQDTSTAKQSQLSLSPTHSLSASDTRRSKDIAQEALQDSAEGSPPPGSTPSTSSPPLAKASCLSENTSGLTTKESENTETKGTTTNSEPAACEFVAVKDEQPDSAPEILAEDSSEPTQATTKPLDVDASSSSATSDVAQISGIRSTHERPVALTSTSLPQVNTNTDDEAFLPNRRPLVATETPPVRPRVPAPKSEASNRVTKVSGTDLAKARKSMPTTKRTIDRSRVSSTSSKTSILKPNSSTSTTSNSRTAQRSSTSSATRLSRGTAASEARSKMASPTSDSPATTNTTSVEDGRAKARERVRKQKLEVEKKRKEGAAKKSASTSRTRATKLTAEEGRTLARERVKRMQASSKGKLDESEKGKENNVRPPNRTMTRRASVASTKSRGTVAKSPQLATKSLLGEKSTGSRNSTREGSRKLDPNPITRALGSPTHSDWSKGSSASADRRLTVPKAPRLSTAAKYGDKPPPTLRARLSKSASQSKPPPTKKRDFKATQPVPFKFHSSKTSKRVPSPTESELSLAERMERYSRKGLRGETSSAPHVECKKAKPTLPKSPQFSSISKRAPPKSTAELEEEMMEYYKTHPFKAAPIGIAPAAQVEAPKPVPKRRLTQPVPFHLRSDDRAAQHSKPPIGTPDPEARDLEECKKQFHARPLPRLSHNPPPKRETVPRSLTTPKPFNFSTDRRAAQSEPRIGQTADDVELSKQFHARPLPQSTYAGPKSRSRSKPPATPREYPGPPKLATSARTEPREAARMASQRNAEKVARQREELALRKKREKHQEEMAKSTLMSPPPNVEPFHLQSEERHRAYQQHLAQELAQEEEDKKRQMLFIAKPLPITDPPQPIHSDKPATSPRPFALRSVSRHERWRKERRVQLEAEETERQRLMNVKAIPLPQSTYKYSPVTPASQTKRQGESHSEERDLNSARKRALEALESAENEISSPDVNVQGRSILGSLMGS